MKIMSKELFLCLNDNMIVFKNVVQRLVDEGHGTGFHGVSHELSKYMQQMIQQ